MNTIEEDFITDIDWSEFIGSEDTCYCRCGRDYRSHTKYVGTLNKMITKKDCPGCTKNNDCWRVVSDPETFEVKGG